VRVDLDGVVATAGYEPGESTTRLYGGNSNWRGPVWLPANLLLVDGLRQHARFHDIDVPDGAGSPVPLSVWLERLSGDVVGLFRRGPDGRRPVNVRRPLLDQDARWSGQLWFQEYFDGDTGAGLGAEHQTGWTATVADLLLRPHRPR
jgi:hypothetical protein